MEVTGTAQLMDDWIVSLIGGLGPLAVLVGIYVMNGLLTDVMSNAAATMLVTQIVLTWLLTP